MKLSLESLPARVINLDRSRDRWIRFCRSFQETAPEITFERVSGVDGREYVAEPKTENPVLKLWKSVFSDETPVKNPIGAWNETVLSRLQSEGIAGRHQLLDPIRTALCMSHQRALQMIVADWEAKGR